MKRKLVKIAIVVAIVAVSGINVFNAQKPEVLSDVAMENVEALAASESTGAVYCPYVGLGCIVKYINGTMETIPDKWSQERH